MSDGALGALIFFGGLFAAAISGARARSQAARLGLGESGAEAVHWLYIGMFLLMSLSGVLYGFGLFGPAAGGVVDDVVDTGVAPSWSDRLRTWIPERALSVPVVATVATPRGSPLPLSRFHVRSGADCRVRWSVLTLTPGGIWLGAERMPPRRLRGGLDVELYDALLDLAETWKDAGARPCPDEPAGPFTGDMLVRVDPAVAPEILRVTLFTAGQAQFGNFFVQVAARDSVPLPDGPPERLPPPWEDSDLTPFLQAVAAHGNGEVATTNHGDDGPWPDMEPVEPRLLLDGSVDAPPFGALPDPVMVVPLQLPRIGPGSRPSRRAQVPGLSLSHGVALGTASRREMKEQLLSIAQELAACVDEADWTAELSYVVEGTGDFTTVKASTTGVSDGAKSCLLALVEGLRVSPPLGAGKTIVKVRMTHHGG